MIKTIVFTGDSHTWGQGDPSVISYFGSVVAGDLRPVPFALPCYVNMVRDWVNGTTGSISVDVDYRMKLEGTFKTEKNCELARFFFACGTKAVICTIDGKPFTIPASWGENAYVSAVVRTNGRPVLEPDGDVFLYRGEFYSGPYAVINSGVGSCTSVRYVEEFYTPYVSAFEPSYIVAEGHSINDWINRVPPDEARQALKTILSHHKEQGCVGILLTVSPIKGATALPFNEIDYSQYIEASRNAGKEIGVVVLEGYKAIKDDQFSDNWHPDIRGHMEYAKLIRQELSSRI